MAKNKINNIINSAIADMAKELNLTKNPNVVFEDNEENWVMIATGAFYSTGLLTKIITKSECDYVIKVNKRMLHDTLKRYSVMFGKKKAAEDFLYLITCHECRHMWQLQEQFSVGDVLDKFCLTETFGGHGSDKKESDANAFMIQIAENKGIKALAEYMKTEQIEGGLSNQSMSFIRQQVKTYIKAVKDYNKPLYYLLKVFNFC